MMKSTVLIAVGIIALAVLAVVALQPFDSGKSEADVTIQGVPIEALRADGFSVNAAPSDASPGVTSEQVTARMKEADPGLGILDVALVTLDSDGTVGIFSERLAWAVSLDPESVEPPQIYGPGNMDQEKRAALRTVAYSVEFFDAQTGDFLMGANSSSFAD